MSTNRSEQPTAPPNIVLLMSDQHRADAMSCEQHPVVRTPALDAIAAQGCRFTRAYTTSPICMPARASLATGRYNHNHGMVGNLRRVVRREERQRSVGLALQRTGYVTAFVGKHHLLPQPPGFDTRLAAGFFKREFGFDHLLHVGGKLASKYSGCDWSAHLEELGLLETHRRDYRARTTKPRYFAQPSSLPRDEQCDSYTGRMALEWLASRPRQPFFLWVSFPGPHNPWDAPGAYATMYDPAAMPLPLAWEEQFEGKPPSQRERSEDSGLLHLDAQELQGMAAHYYGLISNIDDWCGRIISALREAGALDNTVVIYTSDHGEMLGDHRFITKGCFYESAARIPLLVADYRAPAAGATCAAPAETVDTYRTVLEMAGAAAPPGTFGDDLRALADDAAFSELGTACMVRAGRWKYVHDPAQGGPQELYDMEEDPLELRNLVHDPGRRAVAEEARARLLDWRITTDARDLDDWSEIEAQLATAG